jgi:glucose-6-phosphate 1-dehydrogenase
MEPPTSLSTDDVRAEKVKVLKALRPVLGKEIEQSFVRGQYGPGNNQLGYRQENMISPDSNTETFLAGKIMIDNLRWKGVPFYVRTGKRMARKSTKVIIQFKEVPMNFLYKTENAFSPNLLIMDIQPEEGITLTMNVRRHRYEVVPKPVQMQYIHRKLPGLNSPEAYERLLLDCLNGDATNFTHWEEVSHSWKFVDPILEHWAKTTERDFPNYAVGTNGPTKSDELLQRDGFHWWPLENSEE